MGYPQIVAQMQGAGPNVNTFTTAKSITNPQAWWYIPPNFLAIGDKIIVRAQGSAYNSANARTFTFQVQVGPTSNIIGFNGGAATTTNTSHAAQGLPFLLEIHLTVRAVGNTTAANLMGQGMLVGQNWVYSGASADSTSAGPAIMIPNTAPAVGTGFDSTVQNILDLWCGLGTSEATTGLQVHQYEVEYRPYKNP